MLQFLLLLWLAYISPLLSEQDVSTVFGRQGTDCAGRGICAFSGGNNLTGSNSRISYSRMDGYITLQLVRANLSGADMFRQFGTTNTSAQLPESTAFVMDGDYQFSAVQQKMLGLPAGVQKISSGEYSITQSDDFITVRFKL